MSGHEVVVSNSVGFGNHHDIADDLLRGGVYSFVMSCRCKTALE